MLISDFDFELPAELIAQQPADPRDGSRMLVVNRARKTWQDSSFRQVPDFLTSGDVIVVNNTQVFPARLKGRRETATGEATGAHVELFLVRELSRNERGCIWETLARPARRLRLGAHIAFGDGRLRAEVIKVIDSDDGRSTRVVRFECGDDFERLLDELGETPLPPYIKRETADARKADRTRYQTIYAKSRGAIAAPTAGLHWTPRVLAELAAREIEMVELTLHVGYGTFEPVRAEDLREHQVASESYAISDGAAEKINHARARKSRVVAIGTTTVRALESACDESGQVQATQMCATNLTITPGYKFKAIDALLTNFHLPQSSLLVLVAAYAGRELVLEAYRHAVEDNYRFYSYGDCMLIL